MKTSTILILIIALTLLLLLAFSPLLDYTNNKSLEELDEKSVYLTERAREIDLNEEGIDNTSVKPRVVVSLTTIPERIGDLRFTIKSLLKQTYPPDEIAINVPYRTLKGKEYIIPEKLVRLTQKDKTKVKMYRLEKDLGPASKLLPTLKREHPDTKIICVDDDIVYPPMLIESLVKTSNKYPDNAITTFPKRLIYSGNNPPRNGSTWSWMRAQRMSGNGRSDLVLGVFGFLVKPSFFVEQKEVKTPFGTEIQTYPSVYDYSNSPPEAVWVDDIWVSGHLSLRKIPIVSPQFNIHLIALPVVKQQRTVGLIRTVNASGQNDNITIAHFWAMGAFQHDY